MLALMRTRAKSSLPIKRRNNEKLFSNYSLNAVFFAVKITLKREAYKMTCKEEE